MPKMQKKVTTEDKLVKALNELEETVAKGDALQEQDPEGDFAGEGEVLSKKSKQAKMKKGEVASEEEDDDDDADDMNKGSMPEPADMASDEGSDEGDGDDDGSDDESDEGAEKSFREMADEDESLSKAIEVSEFLESLVDTNSRALSQMRKGLAADLNEALGGFFEQQMEFNTRMAKALTVIGKMVQSIAPDIKEQTEIVKSFADQPKNGARPHKSVLSKGDINQPFQQSNDAQSTGPSRHDAIMSWLDAKTQAGEIDPVQVASFELARFDPNALPLNLRKSLLSDLQGLND